MRRVHLFCFARALPASVVALKAGPGQAAARGRSRSVLRTDSPAMLGHAARRRTRCVCCAHSAQTGGAESDNEARCARGHAPCASRRLLNARRDLPGPGFAGEVGGLRRGEVNGGSTLMADSRVRESNDGGRRNLPLVVRPGGWQLYPSNLTDSGQGGEV